jgi:hypothetical protein
MKLQSSVIGMNIPIPYLNIGTGVRQENKIIQNVNVQDILVPIGYLASGNA